MVSRGDQGAVDDPGLPPIRVSGVSSEVGQHRREGDDDAMDGRFREAEDRGEFADREVGAEGNAGEDDAA
jgi:hypothetical protein